MSAGQCWYILGVCVIVSRVALIADAVSLITNTRQLKLQPP